MASLKKMSIHKIKQTNFISFGGWKITHLEKTKYNKKNDKIYEILIHIWDCGNLSFRVNQQAISKYRKNTFLFFALRKKCCNNYIWLFLKYWDYST